MVTHNLSHITNEIRLITLFPCHHKKFYMESIMVEIFVLYKESVLTWQA